jgi:hypothetical protein
MPVFEYRQAEEVQAVEIASGKDFVQLKNGPFDLDLVLAPDGIEGFPVCHIDDVIASKEASGRAKHRESLPRLKAFREYWLEHNR